MDVGRTFCGCWGLDFFYRWHGCQFDRALVGTTALGQDGGGFHHIGGKITWETSFGGSRFFWYVGVGGSYWWTQDLVTNDQGGALFGETGFGYVISQSIRVRVGVDVHGIFSTDATRAQPGNDGSTRSLWVFAPNAGIEIDF